MAHRNVGRRFERLEERRLLATLAINAGGPAVGDFVADRFFDGGRAWGEGQSSVAETIITAGVTDPAPDEVYKTERSTSGNMGSFGYSIPNLIPGGEYTLRLHFAEIFFEEPSKRVFDVTINGQSPPVLDDYDVFAESGDVGAASESVAIEEFNVNAQGDGTLRIDFAASVNNPKLSGLELIGDFPERPRLLFVRGADRSGGFLEGGGDAARTEQLADIFNTSTAGGNHGWAELRQTLESAGFAVEQITESVEPGSTSGQSDGVHIDFELMDLAEYDAIVFGSNNAVYDTAAIDAVDDYVRGGGATLFISDANFGSDWADASNSDQQFVDRFGLIMRQDQGTYSLSRLAGDFDAPNHPILNGLGAATVVDTFDGEGVTPATIGTLPDDVTTTLVANAKGNVRLNNGSGGNNQGSSVPADSDPVTGDAALLVAEAGAGRVVVHYDRNTFFNQNGAGTNINRFDNRQYALNLFGFLVGAFDPLPGDYDGSGTVDAADYTTWKNAFNAVGANAADGNRDGVVDAADFTLWRDNLGASRPSLNLTASVAAAAPSLSRFSVTPEATAAAGTRAPSLASSPVDSDRGLLLLLAEAYAGPTAQGGVHLASPRADEEPLDEDETLDAVFATLGQA